MTTTQRTVPVEATDEMKLVGAHVLRHSVESSRECAASWCFQEMCKAAPPSPAQSELLNGSACTGDCDKIDKPHCAMFGNLLNQMKVQRKEVYELLEAAKALVAKLKITHEASSGIYQIAAIHGVRYNGPNYCQELDAVETAIRNAEQGEK